MVKLSVALPKGHLQEAIFSILDLAGYRPRIQRGRSYSIEGADPEIQFRIHRAQNIGPLVEEGKYDVGITGLDWIKETKTKANELFDLDMGRVNVVAAVPRSVYDNLTMVEAGDTFDKLIRYMRSEGKERIIVASEYENITREFCKKMMGSFPFRFITSYGATETFVQVADMIVDCTQTGATLRDNGWEIVNRLFESTARIIANKGSVKDREKRGKIEDFLSLIKGALDAKNMKLLKMNVPEASLKNIVSILPSMKSPTLSKLYGGDGGYALEVAIRDEEILKLIPLLKKKGATDILEIDVKKVVR